MNRPFSTDQPHTYQIRVRGQLSPHWLAFFADFQPRVEMDPDGATQITLTGRFVDQAALQGALQALYNLGCVLLSVNLRDE